MGHRAVERKTVADATPGGELVLEGQQVFCLRFLFSKLLRTFDLPNKRSLLRVLLVSAMKTLFWTGVLGYGKHEWVKSTRQLQKKRIKRQLGVSGNLYSGIL
jgi:hypothetical protein